MSTGEALAQQAADEFVAALALWRVRREMSKKQLAAAMGFDPSYVSHIEAGRHRPTEDFARRAEAILRTGGQLWEQFRAYDELRSGPRSRVGVPVRDPPVPEQWLPPGTGLVCEREVARLSFVDGRYRCAIRRNLYNAGTEPVTRYPIRIAVDRYPQDSARSNRHHRDHPLTWEELSLVASRGRESMTWRPKTDRDADKEVWLLFENAHGRFPLYPGERTMIVYSYHVGADKWGQWFQRAIRLPTLRLTVEVDFPRHLRPVVWGVETSLSAEAIPLRTPLSQELADDTRVIFRWQTASPSLNALYRLEWRFQPTQDGEPGAPENAPGASHAPGRASDRMRALGVVQRGAPLLTTATRPFDLPRDAGEAGATIDRLTDALERAATVHRFAKGAGLAAPQIGLDRAVAVIRPPERGAEPIVLLNPRILWSSPDLDQRYEGCLSFFDVRGLVARPLRIRIERTLLTGERVVEAYERALARLISHEIDHLNGTLYIDRMAPDLALVPVEEYDETGHPWRY